MRVKTHKGLENFINFIDNYSQFGYVYLIIHKPDELEKFKEFKKM